jgi:hypothetical protein
MVFLDMAFVKEKRPPGKQWRAGRIIPGEKNQIKQPPALIPTE